MTGLDHRGRLRKEAEGATGARVVVSRDDLLLLLDELARPQGPVPAPRAPQGEPAGVRLAPTRVDAGRLARAAWEAEPGRVATHGSFDEASPALTQFVLMTALDALRILAGQAPQADDRPPTPACQPEDVEDPFAGPAADQERAGAEWADQHAEAEQVHAWAGPDAEEEAPY